MNAPGLDGLLARLATMQGRIESLEAKVMALELRARDADAAAAKIAEAAPTEPHVSVQG